MKHHLEFDVEFKENENPGKFIVFEGNEGSGKSVQVEKVVEKLQKEGLKVIKTKEPTDLPIGKFIREEVLTGKTQIPPISLQYLYCADRVMHVAEIEKLLKEGYIVVSDRYFWSSVAYGVADIGKEGVQDDEFYLIAFSILSMYNRFLLPDLTIFIDVDLETAMKRISASKKHVEIYDNERMWKKIQKGYDFLLRKFPNQIISVDGTKSIEEISNEIIEKIKAL